MGSKVEFDGKQVVNGLELLKEKFYLAIEAFAESASQKLESYAKENARWQNRTGHARQRLTGDYTKEEDAVRLRLAHGVDYGKWLELANEKKYSIIPETIEIVGEGEIMPAFENFMEKLK